MAARKATLFGKNVEKAPFFKTTSSPYYNVINALWQLEDTDDREKFLKSAQTRWMEVYRADEAVREELFVCTAHMYIQIERGLWECTFNIFYLQMGGGGGGWWV